MLNSTPDDLALVRQIQHGDEAALAEFYQRFAPGLYSFIRRRLNSPQDIEDILGETMTAAVTAIMRFRGQSQVFTWLCRIAEFKVADHYRRQPQHPVLPLNEAVNLSTPNGADLEANLLIWQALHQLNHQYRQVLQAKYFEGYSTREIAQRIGKSEKAAEAMLVRARQSFARIYRQLAPELEV